MRKKLQKVVKRFFMASALLMSLGKTQAQVVSTFESLNLPVDSFWNGSDQSGFFTCGDAKFYNDYYGGYWVGGWAYSTMRNDSVGNYSNMYSAVTASGHNASKTYALGNSFSPSPVSILNSSKGKTLQGAYFTNTTLVDSSLSHGDGYAKKFGGTTGNDSDWFKLTIKGFLDGQFTDSVDFYLADFRFADNSKDYIIRKWTWVDLSKLKNVDSLTFQLSSSDTSAYGMNTPAFFAMDNFNDKAPVGIQNYAENTSQGKLYPNPVQNNLFLEGFELTGGVITITDLTGRVCKQIQNNVNNLLIIDLHDLEKGLYLITFDTQKGKVSKKIIKQ